MFLRIKPAKLIFAALIAFLALTLLTPVTAYALTSTTAELRSDHLRAGSLVPEQGIFLKNNGNCFPLSSATVVTNTLGASYTAHPIGNMNNASDSTGYWIANPSSTAYATSNVPGVLTLKWSEIGYDTQRNSLDMTLQISNVTVKEGANSTASQWVRLLLNNSQRLVVSGNANPTSVSGSASAKVGVEMKITVTFTKHSGGGTPSGAYLFSAVDLDMADRCTTAGSIYYPESGGYYTESIVLNSGFNSNVYFQADHTDGIDPGPTNLRINGNRIYGTAPNDHDNEMRNGFVVKTTGSSFSFNWIGSDCATGLFREASGIHIDDKNVSASSNASGHGIITPSVSTAGIPHGGVARTADTYRVSTLSWKQNATYDIKAQAGYRVTTVQVIPESGTSTTLNAPKTISFGPNAMNAAAGYFTSDRNYQIIVTTAAVPNATASITAKKMLSGRNLANGEFSFELYEGNTKIETKTNAADGTVTFSTLSYTYDSSTTYPKTHTYTIRENTSNLPANVTGDTSSKTVTVTENYNASTGAYTTSISGNNPTFNNTFTPPNTSATITAKKTLSGRALAAGEFSFDLYEGNTKIETKTNAADGTVTFSTISYSYDTNTTYPKTHTYTIKEVSGSRPHVTYDGASKTVTVTENYNSSTGAYTTSVSGNNPTFNNTFTPPTTSATITAKKMLSGRSLVEGEFSFDLYESSNKIETKTNAQNGTISFTDLSYTYDPTATYPKTHTYTIKENNSNLPPNVTGDTSTKTVTVTENYNASTGAYTASVSGNNPTFNNTFSPQNTSITIAAEKTLNGRDLVAGEFSFDLYEGDTYLGTKTNAGNGEVVFDTIVYSYDADETYPKTHTYTIKENNENLPPNVTGDTSTKTVTVTENYNATSGAYTASVNGNNPTFNNTFVPDDVSVTITAVKTLTGRDLSAGEFSFDLYEGDAHLGTKTNAGNGEVVFDTITYSYDANETYPKTHTYTIKESSGSLPHVTYDEAPKTVTVTEDYNTSTGTYSVAVSGNNPTFSNAFTPPQTTVDLKATKTISGRDLATGEFSFDLYEGSNKIETKSNAANGSVNFSTITYTYDPYGTYPKTHTYKITEVQGELPHVAYDTSEKEITVTEDYNAQTGAYTATATDNSPTFSNTFTPPSASAAITAKKSFQDGGSLQANQFSFILADESSDIETAYNDASGNIAFSPIGFDYVPGDTYPKTHTYTIREVPGQEPFMVYDTETKSVTVTETYNDTTGVYNVTASPVPTFTNRYIPHSIQIEKTAAQTHYENAKAGDPVTWNFTVTNTGSGALAGVYIEDEYLGSTQVQLLSTSLAAQGSSGNSTTGSAVTYLTQDEIDCGWVENTAIAHGHAPQWPSVDVVSSPSTARVTINQSPSISLDKTALETEVSPGNTVHYQFKITNTGNTTLTNVKLTDGILGINETVSAKLLPGESVTVGGASATGYSKVATSADFAARKIDNTATATGTPPSGSNVTDTDTATVPVVPPTLLIEKTGALTNTGGVVQVGDTVLWTATITNTCDVTIDDIVLHDDYLTSKGIAITPQKTSLAPGEHTTATATSPLSQDEVNAGSVTNVIKASGVVHATATDTIPIESNTDDATVNYARTAKLAITKTVDKANADLGDTLNYEIVITNTGNVTLAPVTFKDELVGITGSGTNSIAAQSLAPGASVTLNVKYEPVSEADAAAGAVDNIVFANGTPPTGVTPPDEVSANAHTVITTKPVLELEKTVDKQLIDPAQPGDVVTWTFTLRNSGDIALGSLAIEDEQLNATGVTVEIPSDDVIEPGQSKEYSASQAVTQADIDAGNIVNVATATATAPGMSEPVKSNEATASVELCQHPAISLEKEVDRKEIPIAKPGDMLTYTFKVTNTGDIPVSDITLDDRLAGVTLNPLDWTKKLSTDASTADVQKLFPGESIELSGTYLVTANDIAAGKVINTAQAFADYGSKDLIPSNEATAETILGKEIKVEDRDDDLASIMHTGDSPLPYVLIGTGISGIVALIMVRTRRRSR